jgi:two-component system nitrogen regulation sensor histidine kinase NtrY
MQAPCSSCLLAWSVAAAVFVLAAVSLLRLRSQRGALQGELARLATGAARDLSASDLLRAVLDASPLAVILCAENGRIVVENEAARRLFFAGQSAQGQNFLRLVANGPAAYQSALLHASDEIIELKLDGRVETYHFTRRRLAHQGELHSLLSVRPMTREVARRDLDVLQKVVRVLSHEVNNSLAPVTSLVHSARLIVRAGERIERLDTVFDTIEERSRHLSTFVAGYASLSRLPKPVQRLLPWSSVLGRLAVLYPDVTLSVPDGAQGFFDPGQIEQVLINLLKNAGEAGGAREAVRLEVRPGEHGGSELCALDRGQGFSVEALDQALLPFFTTKASGHGIGLALAREVVDAHGGELSIANRPDGGAAVRVWLPGPQPDTKPESRARMTLTNA